MSKHIRNRAAQSNCEWIAYPQSSHGLLAGRLINPFDHVQRNGHDGCVAFYDQGRNQVRYPIGGIENISATVTATTIAGTSEAFRSSTIGSRSSIHSLTLVTETFELLIELNPQPHQDRGTLFQFLRGRSASQHDIRGLLREALVRGLHFNSLDLFVKLIQLGTRGVRSLLRFSTSPRALEGERIRT